MIDSLHGVVLTISDETMVVDVSGFGIRVYPTASLLSKYVEGDEIFLLTYMQVSEAGISMFGFSTERERELFLELLQVKTVGGKLAINLLKHLSDDQILKAIITDNISVLSVPGVGAKRAERICFELKKKIEKKFPDVTDTAEAESGIVSDRFVLDALRSLGFSMSEALKAVSVSKKNNPEINNEEDLLKVSLSYLQKL